MVQLSWLFCPLRDTESGSLVLNPSLIWWEVEQIYDGTMRKTVDLTTESLG